MRKPDQLSILSKQVLSIKEQADAALELILMMLNSKPLEEDKGEEKSDAPELPPVFGRRKNTTDDSED